MLEITNVINISVQEAPTGLAGYNVNNVALMTSDPTPSGWSAGQVYGVYVSASAVGVDFGTTSETYLQAVSLFSQNPNILAGGGALIVIPLLSTSSSSSSSCRSSSSSSSSSY